MKYKTIRGTLEDIESYVNYYGNRIVIIEIEKKDNNGTNTWYKALVELKEEKNER